MPFEGTVKQAYSNLSHDQQITAYQFILFLVSISTTLYEQKAIKPMQFDTQKGKIHIDYNFDDPIIVLSTD